MKDIDSFIVELESQKQNIRFSRLLAICEQCFGSSRIAGSHPIFKTPWPGDPRINLQTSKGDKGKVKPYQIRQVLFALKKLKEIGL